MIVNAFVANHGLCLSLDACSQPWDDVSRYFKMRMSHWKLQPKMLRWPPRCQRYRSTCVSTRLIYRNLNSSLIHRVSFHGKPAWGLGWCGCVLILSVLFCFIVKPETVEFFLESKCWNLNTQPTVWEAVGSSSISCLRGFDSHHTVKNGSLL